VSAWVGGGGAARSIMVYQNSAIWPLADARQGSWMGAFGQCQLRAHAPVDRILFVVLCWFCCVHFALNTPWPLQSTHPWLLVPYCGWGPCCRHGALGDATPRAEWLQHQQLYDSLRCLPAMQRWPLQVVRAAARQGGSGPCVVVRCLACQSRHTAKCSCLIQLGTAASPGLVPRVPINL
jgi:hypothetical protein